MAFILNNQFTMQGIIVISTSFKVLLSKNSPPTYLFKFGGVFKGQSIKEIRLYELEGNNLVLFEEYVLYVFPIEVKNKILYGKVLKFKKLNDFKIEY